MKFRPVRLGLARSLVAISVSLAVVVSTHVFAFTSLARSTPTASSQSELQITSANATASPAGVLLQWSTNSAADNLGFNIYRLKDGLRTRANREIIPGAVFASGSSALRDGYSYAWFDRGGAASSTYYIESVSLQGTAKIYEAVRPVASKTVSGFETTETAGAADASASANSFEKYYPTAETDSQLNSLSSLEEQFAIAAQTCLKIGIKKDDWYRVTQAQMAAAGFNPTVEINNLRLFVDGQEVAINTSQRAGTFGSGDYIEFYGRGLDTPTSDTRTYYLIAGTTSGKRVRGENQLDGSPVILPTPTPAPPTPPLPLSSPPAPQSTPQSSPPITPAYAAPLLRAPVFNGSAQRDLNVWIDSLGSGTASGNEIKEDGRTRDANRQSAVAQAYYPPTSFPPDISQPRDARPIAGASTEAEPGSPRSANRTAVAAAKVETKAASAVAPPSRASAVRTRAGQLRQRASNKKRKKSKRRRAGSREHNHAVVNLASSASSFDYTAERKDRTVYFVTVLNGDKENWFGQVITYSAANPARQTITTPNPDLTAAGPARLEIALQGVNLNLHQVSVEFNGVVVGSFSFFGYDPNTGGHSVQVFDIPVTQLQNGANTIRFILPGGGDVSIVDYVKLSYPHTFRADANSLKFNLRGTQSVKVDGFAAPTVRLIDYTDPAAVSISRPAVEPSASGFAITVPNAEPVSKTARLLYAIPADQFAQPASLTLNQPSSLNLSSNAGDFLIVSHKDFIASVEPLRLARENQGFTAKVVNVEDVYDEFGYGAHGPQAVKDFLSRAATQWVTKPRYIVFAGDSSYDARNYSNGNFDFVPTKLVDATYNETAADDWLADFDNDGVADIPVGRLPVRTVAEAAKVVDKIVNYAPANVPQAALLVADDPGTPPVWDFEEGNDHVQTLLPASMTVQRVNVRTEPSTAQATADVVSGLNQGRAIVNYSGHGNVDVWASSSIFRSADATALTNGNKLSFVVVMDCLNGYFHDPFLLSLSEAFLKAPNGGAVAAFASSGLTTTYGQRQMELELYRQLYGAQPIALGDAIKIAKAASEDIDVRRTWIYFGDPSIKIR